jgi:hypothetical protein
MVKFNLLKHVLLAGMCLGAFGSALASPFVTTFSISGFSPVSPVQSVTGSISFEASSLYAPIDHLSAIDLTINGHSYTLQEVGFITDTPADVAQWPTTIVGGKLNGVDALNHYTDDFWLRWRTDTHEWVDFYYSSTTEYYVWGTSQWDSSATAQFKIAAPVPEPTEWALLLAGLSLLGGLGARQKSRKTGG